MEGGIREYARKAASKAKADRVAQGREPSSPERKYIGVRSRPGNKFGAEIIEPETGKRLWLGTYDTRDEAACAYDYAARTMKPNARTNFPDLGEEDGESAAAAVLAHFAATKRKLADRLMEEAAEAAVAAARDAVSAAPAPPAPAPATAGDLFDLNEPPTSFPGEEDVVAALEILKNQQGAAASCKNKKAAEPVGSSSVSPSPPSSVPAASAPHFAPAPVSGVSASHSTTLVLAPAPLNFMFPSPHAMPPAPAIRGAPSIPAAPSPPAPASGPRFAPVFDPTPLAFNIPRGTAPPPGFLLAPAPPTAVVSAAPPSSTLAPAPGSASASYFASFFAPAPAPPTFHLPHDTAAPLVFHPAPGPPAPAITSQTWAFLYENCARFSQLEAQQYLRTLRRLLSLSSFGAGVTNTSSAFQPYASSSSAAPAIPPEAELAVFRHVYRMLERQAAGGLGDVRVDNPSTQDGRHKKQRRGEA